MTIGISSDIEERLSPQINGSEKRMTVNFSRQEWTRDPFSMPFAARQIASASDRFDEVNKNRACLIVLGPQIITQGLVGLAVRDVNQFCFTASALN